MFSAKYKLNRMVKKVKFSPCLIKCHTMKPYGG